MTERTYRTMLRLQLGKLRHGGRCSAAGLKEALRGELEVHGEAQDVRAQQVRADEPGHELLRLRVHAEALVTGACMAG